MKRNRMVSGMLLCLAAGLAGGCFSGHMTTENTVKTENTVEVKPIRITIDVNVHVQKDLDNFFGDIDRK